MLIKASDTVADSRPSSIAFPKILSAPWKAKAVAPQPKTSPATPTTAVTILPTFTGRKRARLAHTKPARTTSATLSSMAPS